MINQVFSETPILFGGVHICAIVLIAAFNIAATALIRKPDEKSLLKILNRLGLLMLAAEIFKQWFCHRYVFGGELNLWFFPWQLCSMAMYLSFLAIYLKGRWQTAALVFLATYSLVADIVALLLPYDMLRPQIALLVHSFAFHGLVLTESIIAMAILSKKRAEEISFGPATLMFFGMAAIAEVINVTAHAILNNIHREPNMFYITPVYPTTQPILHEIAEKWGILPEVIIYLAVIVSVSYAVFRLQRRLYRKMNTQ